MNQDNYMEESFKMRNVLREFLRHQGMHRPTILGLREHRFTLRVRFHYGHPDLFDRLFHLTRCGISKALKTINLSEDVLLLYLVLSGLEKAILLEAKIQNIQSLETALAPQSYIQLGLLTGLPMVMEIGLERGFLIALKDFFLMQLQLAAAIFTFNLGTKSHYYGRTILHEGAKNYRLYSRSHFMKGFELLLLLVVYDLFSRSYRSSMAYVLITYAVWFFAVTWLFAPFLFNPSGFNWGKVVDDWKDWNKWIKQQGGIGIQQDKSRQSWWNDEQAHHRHSGLCSRLIEGTGLWHFTWVFARAYDYGMGVVLFAPTASLAWLPIISDFQTHFLLNEAFSSRRLQIEPILAGKKSSIDEPLPHVIVYITF